MDPQALQPFGAALRAYFEGDTGAELILHRDDGDYLARLTRTL